MAIMRGIDTSVSVTCPAASRKLAELDVALRWTPKPGRSAQPSCCCVAFAEEHLVHSGGLRSQAAERVEASRWTDVAVSISCFGICGRLIVDDGMAFSSVFSALFPPLFRWVSRSFEVLCTDFCR